MRRSRTEPRAVSRAVALYQSADQALEAAVTKYGVSPSVLLRRYITAGLIVEGFLPEGTPAEPPLIERKSA
jgi:hypothetical protein